jgi:NAD(P)-dependent dehydrogenase (short-subunit alcohol dehydrogenase family)
MAESFLIIGGGSDIAQVLVKKLLEHKHKVTMLVRNESSINDFILQECSIVVGDALSSDDLQSAIDVAIKEGDGRMSGVAHLVGSILIRPPHALKVEAFEEVIQTNLVSAFLTLSKSCKALLKSGGGRVVFTSSVAASLGLVNHEAISAAKGGIESMVRSAAATYAQRNIRVNAIAPGLTDTKLSESIIRSESLRESAVSMIPMKRINQPEEVAEGMFWLLTSAPDNLTGQIIHLDGGMRNVRN